MLPSDLIVRGLSFKGNHAIDDYTLSISIATSQSSWGARIPVARSLIGEKRYFDPLEFRRDVVRIQALYHLSGYLDARVDTVVRRGKDDVHIQFIITEGEPVRVTELSVKGAEGAMPTRDILATLPLQVGSAFNRFLLRTSGDTIRTLLENLGYPFVEVASEYQQDSTTGSVRVAFTVDPGHLARISAVAVIGANKVSSRVVRRAVGLRAGQPFSGKSLYDTQSSLYRTDLFTYVNVGLVDSVRTSPDDSLVAIQVQVNEGKLHVVRGGGGYGALDCFRGLAGWTGRNFFGGGRSLDVTGRLSKVGTQVTQFCMSGEHDPGRRRLNYEATASLHEPFLLGRRTSGSLSLFAERHSEINAFTRIAQGGEIGVNQLLTPTMPLNFTYNLSVGQTIADPAIFCTFLNICQLEDTIFSTRRRESTVGVGLAWNRANSVLDASRGTALSLQVRYASPLTGSDEQRQFTRGTIEFAAYHPIGERGVFAWRVRLGAVLAGQQSVAGGSQRFVPPDERLYLGGPNTVRGFGQNELGPLVRVITGFDSLKTSDGKRDSLLADGSRALDTLSRASPTGGDRLVLANVELRLSIWGRLQGAAFVDVGEIYGGQPRAPDEALHVTPGIGLRFGTPLGPIRVDVGYNPRSPTPGPLYQPVPGELRLVQPDYQPPPPRNLGERLQFHFSVGQAF